MMLINAHKIRCERNDYDTYRDYMTAFNSIMNAPTIDAVPVIRCYECKYFREFEKGFSTDWDGSCKYWNTHSTVYSNFCGCAERKEE